MFVVFELDPVQERGGARIVNALHWPVFFVVGDGALRFLAGDVTASDWLHAPGPLTLRESLIWRAEISASCLASGGYVGFGLMYSAGGADMESTQAVYRQLIATVQSLVLQDVARGSGLGVLLGAFGASATGADTKRRAILDHLHEGIDPDELIKELDSGLLKGIDAFRTIGESMLPFMPKAVLAQSADVVPSNGAAVAGAAAVASITALANAITGPNPNVGTPVEVVHLLERRVLGGFTVPQHLLQPVPAPVLPTRPVALVPTGAVVAKTLQAWRIGKIHSKRTMDLQRALPTRAAPRLSLQLAGRVRREG